MILESYYWKNDLDKRAAWLRKRLTQKRWTEVSFARLEQTLMLGFYSIRKLIEAKKLCNTTVAHQVQITAYPASGELVTRINRRSLDELYSLDAGQTTTRDLQFLCNQFIHSYVFVPVFSEDLGLFSIIVASDRERNRNAYHVEASQIISLFELVGSDNPNFIQHTYNECKQDLDVEVIRKTRTG